MLLLTVFIPLRIAGPPGRNGAATEAWSGSADECSISITQFAVTRPECRSGLREVTFNLESLYERNRGRYFLNGSPRSGFERDRSL